MQLRFDFPDEAGGAAPRVFRDPGAVHVAWRVEEVVPALRAVERAVEGGMSAAGYIAYEAAPAFDAALRARTGSRMPLLWFGIFPEAARPDREPGQARGGASVGDWEEDVARADYDRAILRIRDAIAEGRTYQVNFSTRLRAPFAGDAEQLYHRLRRAQGSGYHAYLDLGEHQIVSVSPELFFRTESGRIIARPMKGTMPRGRWSAEDVERCAALHDSEKNRAENLMIVDLVRNDLGRIAVTGTVEVPRLFDIERYHTVFQMTSTVTACLREACGITDILRALFPCGSVTGAPKISTSAMIAELESTPREVYCGAIGWIEPGGKCAFNVPIRTLWVDRAAGVAEYGIGGGITWDSTARGEYDEMLAKAAVLREDWPDFELIETLRFENGVFQRLPRHLSRLRESCAYFGFDYRESEVLAALEEAVRGHGVSDALRARVTVSSDGRAHATADPLETMGTSEPQPVALCTEPVSSADRFLYHKTTHRHVYTSRAELYPGAWDVLLQNERGESTEFTRGNVVIERGGELLTPPRDAGLLEGCLRAELLEKGRIRECAVTAEDVRSAERIWFINSVRGWVPVYIAPRSPRHARSPGSLE